MQWLKKNHPEVYAQWLEFKTEQLRTYKRNYMRDNYYKKASN